MPLLISKSRDICYWLLGFFIECLTFNVNNSTFVMREVGALKVNAGIKNTLIFLY